MSGSTAHAAHSVLEYMISRATLEGKIGTTSITLLLEDLLSDVEGPRVSEEGEGIGLKVTVSTEWTEAATEEELVTDLEDTEELNGRRKSNNKDKKSN